MRLRPLLLACMALAGGAAVLGQGANIGCAGTPPCERNSDCAAGYCSDGECKKDCVVASLDCPRGYICNEVSQCEPGTGAAGGGGANPTGGGGSATTSSSSTTTSSTSTTSGSGGAGAGAPGSATEFELCGADGDCASSLVCRALVKGSNKRCTRTCSSSAQCMTGTACLADGAGMTCLGSDLGRNCGAAEACNFACAMGPGYCTVPCVSGSDCPNGWGCMPVGGQRVCVRAEAYCDDSNTSGCIVSSACDLSPNMILGGCTLACDSAADCPQRAAGLPAWTCDGLCRRPGDVYGSLPGGQAAEYYCNLSGGTVNLCNDGLHMNFAQFSVPNPPSVNCQSPNSTPGVAGDACVDSCRYQGGCPFNFACVGLAGTGTNRIGLCLPMGVGEPGAACTTDGQCEFAYCLDGTCSRDCTLDGICPNGLSCVTPGADLIEGQPFRRCE